MRIVDKMILSLTHVRLCSFLHQKKKVIDRELLTMDNDDKYDIEEHTLFNPPFL